ncbi:MAG: 1-acyl-sn-glycerol-3-phosphate acyltransferase [Cyclobacteriaceae bacterium]
MSTTLREIIPRSPIHALGRWLFSLHCFTVFNTYLKLKVHGKQHLPEGPFIICSNHQSHLDAIILSHIGAFFFSRSAMIAAKDYWFDDKMRFFFSRFFFCTIPISRRETTKGFGIIETTRLVKEFVANKGRSIVILPEGTRSMDEKIKPFKKGVVTLSKITDLPIVPVYIQDSGRFWPKGSFFIKPGNLTIRIGKPIFPSDLSEYSDGSIVRERIIELANYE